MRILPTTSRTAVSAACTTASVGFLLSNRNARASLSRYCTANLISTMFSSSVSMADSRRPVALMIVSRPTSTDRICVTNTSSWRWIGYGSRQLKPAPTELLYLPNWVITACWPSWTMKKTGAEPDQDGNRSNQAHAPHRHFSCPAGSPPGAVTTTAGVATAAAAPVASAKQASELAVEIAPQFVEIRRSLVRALAAPTPAPALWRGRIRLTLAVCCPGLVVSGPCRRHGPSGSHSD
jgi:hypothetical protein